MEITKDEIELLGRLWHRLRNEADECRKKYGFHYSSQAAEDYEQLTRLIQKVVPDFT